MKTYLDNKTEYGWYLCLNENNIVAGMGVIKNDFHNMKDLFPNVCAVYTEKSFRGKGIAGKLLNMVVDDMKAKGITPIYLLTDIIGFYERYGWNFCVWLKEMEKIKNLEFIFTDNYIRCYFKSYF